MGFENMANVFFVASKFGVTRRAKYYIFRQIIRHIAGETLKLVSSLWTEI
jgi:hypothetical protein